MSNETTRPATDDETLAGRANELRHRARLIREEAEHEAAILEREAEELELDAEGTRS